MTADPVFAYSTFLFHLFIWGTDQKSIRQKTPKCIMQWQKNMVVVNAGCTESEALYCELIGDKNMYLRIHFRY